MTAQGRGDGTGADVVVRILAEAGFRHAFGIISIHNMPLFEAMRRDGRITAISTRHEQAAVHAADGYARATGRPGLAIASTGPGTTNTVTGLYEAGHASSPVLVVTGQAETAFLGRGVGYVHEFEAQQAMLRTVTKRAESPRTADALAPALHAVIAELTSGRPGPAAIEIPIDLQQGRAPGYAGPAAAGSDAGADESLERIAERIRAARRRVIIAGGGVIRAGAGAALVALAEALEAPVLTTANGRGAIPETHRLCIGNLGASPRIHEGLADVELTIAVGTRFQAGVGGAGHRNPPQGELVHLDIDPGVPGRVYPTALRAHGDADALLTALAVKVADAGGDGQFAEGLAAVRDEVRAGMRERIGPDYAAIMDAMRELLPDTAPIVRDSTQAAYFFANTLLPILAQRTSISPTSGAIGPGLPLGIGAAVGTGVRTLVIHGDGGFQFHATELATAARHRIPVTVCVFNDGGFGILRRLQQDRYGAFGDTDLGFTDFAKLADSMGVPARRIGSATEFRDALAESVGAQGPYLIDLDMTRLVPMAGMILPG